MLCPKCKNEIPEDSMFCQYCGNPQQNPAAEELSEKKKKTALGRWILLLAFALLAMIGGYWGTYFAAREYASQGDFAKANQYLLLPSVTQLHDKNLPVYVAAGTKLQNGDFEGASQSFELLSGMDYMDASMMHKEAQYQYALSLAESGEYTKAQELLSILAAASYKDSNALKESVDDSIVFLDSLAILEAPMRGKIDEDTAGRIRSYKQIASLAEKGCPLAVDGLGNAKELLYNYGIQIYKNGYGRYARAVFVTLSSYKRSEDYKTLCRRDNYQALLRLIGFEDANEIILSEYPREFLHGIWLTEVSENFFMLFEDQVTYDLPTYNTEDYHYFDFYDGVYYACNSEILTFKISAGLADLNDSGVIRLFHFSIKDFRTIYVYCYANGMHYELHRP